MYCKKCGSQIIDNSQECPNCSVKNGDYMIEVFNYYKPIVWSALCNDSDCCIYPNISSNLKNSIRNYFHIDHNEEILFIRDTSFWNSENQGLVISDAKFVCIPDNESPDSFLTLNWQDIERVDYKDHIYRFICHNNEYLDIHARFFFKDADYADDSLAVFFTQIAQLTEPKASELDIICEQLNKLYIENKYDEAVEFTRKYKNSIDGGLYLYSHAVMKCNTVPSSEKIRTFNECIKNYNDNEAVYNELLYYKFTTIIEDVKKEIPEDVVDKNIVSQYYLNSDMAELRKCAYAVASYTTDDEETIFRAEESKKHFETLDFFYTNYFKDLPYNKRKILLPVKEYLDLSQNSIAVADITKLSEINFPIGHPQPMQLYVGHPYLSNKYIPFENYELELIEDKVREFCYFVQCLGATEISIETVNSMSSEEQNHQDRTASGNAKYMMAKASGSYNRKNDSRMLEALSKSLNLNQEFAPQSEPKLPQGLVWYDNEPSWQRIYEQRMSGNLLNHSEKIETRRNRVVDNSEMTSIQGEFKSLIISANGKWDNKMDEKFESQENATLSIQVKFAPLNSLKNLTKDNFETTMINSNLSSSSYSTEEQEYIEEFKSCLDDDIISTSERRLLEKLRIGLGLSEEVVARLEASITKPALTEDESDYLEEFKACYDEGGDISNSERRLLVKLQSRSGISDERVNELEQQYINSKK